MQHLGRARPPRGFTLIELLVVLLIITIVLGVVGVNLNPDREAAVREEAKRLVLLLQTAQQDAILQGHILAVAFEPQGYHFLAINNKRELKPLPTDGVLHPRTLPAGITISGVDIDGASETETPRLILLPTGELPAFSITLSQGEIRWQVQGKFSGEITALTMAAPGKA
jgi:general secretion pathway protein H